MDKHVINTSVEKATLVDEGNGVIRVKGGLTLSDESEQHNGTRYDIKTLDTSGYDGTLFANHGNSFGDYTIDTVIGKLIGVTKSGKRLFAEGIKYAINGNPLSQLAYNMTREGFLDSFSIGTMGDSPDASGIYRGHKLFEVSQVGLPNNKNAKINQIVANSIAESKRNGLDTSELESALSISKSNEVTGGKPVEEVKKEGIDMTKVDNSCDSTCGEKADKAEAPVVETKELETNSPDLSELIKNAIAEATSPLTSKIAELEKNAFDMSAQNPRSHKVATSAVANDRFSNVASNWKERFAQSFDAWVKHDRGTLNTIKEYNVNLLKKDGLVPNAVGFEEFSDFVSCPEQLTEILGCKNNYRDFADNFAWQETNRLQTQFLIRQGDVESQPLNLCDHKKPVTSYSTTPRTASLELFGAITPLCTAAERFLVVDVLGDIADSYRRDYDRSRARLVVGRWEMAVDNSGGVNSVVYPDEGTDAEKLDALRKAIAQLCQCTPNPRLYFNCNTKAEIDRLLISVGGGSNLAASVITGGGYNSLFGVPYTVVPNDLLPDLDVFGDTRTVVVEGQDVVIEHAIFATTESNFSGRVSGGLQYQLFDQGTYEDVDAAGNVILHSAVQENLILIRGEHYRGGFVKLESEVAGLINGTNTVS